MKDSIALIGAEVLYIYTNTGGFIYSIHIMLIEVYLDICIIYMSKFLEDILC